MAKESRELPDKKDGPVLAAYQGVSVLQRRPHVLLSAFLAVCVFFGMFVAVIPMMALKFVTALLGLMALLVIWLLPDTGKPPVRLMQKLFFSYFLIISLWPYYLAIQLPGMPLLEFRRFAAVGAFLCLAISFSVSSNFRGRISEIFNSAPIARNFFFAFVIVQFLSITLASEKSDVFSALVNNQIAWTAIFIISAYIFSIEGNIVKFTKYISFCALILSIIAFLEARNQGILWANHIPSFLQVNDPVMEYLLSPVFRSGEYRVTGPFSVSLVFAEYMALVVPFFLHYMIYGKNLYLRVFSVFMDCMIIMAIIETQARIGIIGVLIAHGVYGLIWAFNQWVKNKGSLLAPAIVLAYPACLVLSLVAIFSSRRLNMMVFGDGTQAASNQGRIDQFIAAAPLIMKRPIFGYGAGEGAGVLDFRNPIGRLSIDSSILSLSLDYGIPGLVAYAGLIAALIYLAVKVVLTTKDDELAYAGPVAVSLLIWSVSRLILAQQDNMSFMFMIMGAAIAIIYRAKNQNNSLSSG